MLTIDPHVKMTFFSYFSCLDMHSNKSGFSMGEG